eukprot:6214195-Pleurochrysis_carterae.AAC.7
MREANRKSLPYLASRKELGQVKAIVDAWPTKRRWQSSSSGQVWGDDFLGKCVNGARVRTATFAELRKRRDEQHSAVFALAPFVNGGACCASWKHPNASEAHPSADEQLPLRRRPWPPVVHAASAVFRSIGLSHSAPSVRKHSMGSASTECLHREDADFGHSVELAVPLLRSARRWDCRVCAIW